MDPLDVQSDTYIGFDLDKDLKYKVGDHVRISIYKNIFAGYIPNWSKVNNSVPRIYEIRNLNGEQIVEMFYDKKLQKTNQIKFRIK